MRIVLALMCLPLAACPRPGGGGGGGDPAPLGTGCPTANSVYVASYVTPEPGEKGYTGWALPLHDKVVESFDGVGEYAQLDAAAATAAGVPAPPPTVWLYGGPQPCKAAIGAYYAARVEQEGAPKNITYGVELSGCAAPPDPDNASAIVVASESPPTGCQLVPPRGVSQRLGEVDDKGVWKRPVKETAPIPPAIADVLPKQDCTAPSCEQVWSIAQIDVAGKPVAWAGAVNWLATGATPDEPCTWKAERFSGFFVAGPDGAPVKVAEGQDHPLALTAVLADASGAKVLVAEGPGEYSTFDLGGGKATLGRHLVWLRPPPDAYEIVDHLGPVCPE